MRPDSELLRLYIEKRSEGAFAELVGRHLRMVHSCALRRVGGDKHLADDVTQIVFNDLARKARRLVTRPTLSGWLYVSAQKTSAGVVRRLEGIRASRHADSARTDARSRLDDPAPASRLHDPRTETRGARRSGAALF